MLLELAVEGVAADAEALGGPRSRWTTTSPADRLVFLRRVIAGSADKSYGLHVARLARLPAAVVERAGEVLANLEAKEYDPAGRPTPAAPRRARRGRGRRAARRRPPTPRA